MSSTGLAAIAPFVSRIDGALRTLGFDLKQWTSNLDIAIVGIVMLVAALGFLLYDTITSKLAGNTVNAANFHSYGRSLLSGAAEAWQNRHDLGLDPYFAGVRGRSLDMDNVSHVLDAISNAVLQWESPILSTAARTTHNTITHPKFLSTSASTSHNTITHPKFPSAAASAPATQGHPGWPDF